MKELREPNDSEDVMLMMEFRQTYWDEWAEFLSENGYKPIGETQ